MKTKKYNEIKCDLCGHCLDSLYDMVLYNCDKEGKIVELEFRHHVKCDDKKFEKSRHVKDGFDDLLLRFFERKE